MSLRNVFISWVLCYNIEVKCYTVWKLCFKEGDESDDEVRMVFGGNLHVFAQVFAEMCHVLRMGPRPTKLYYLPFNKVINKRRRCVLII